MNEAAQDVWVSARDAEKEVVARIGLISDTHMPDRCRELPSALGDVFHDVDLVLHAGDVGELWVLDQLSALAPVVAVHGNDETADAQQELPYQGLITVAGVRILLWHSHYPDRVDEMQSRRSDEIGPKLARSVERARRAGARVAVFGHWHIPLVCAQDGITVVNPGAIAPGNAISRQLYQTVARLLIYEDGTFDVTHVDLADPAVPFVCDIDWDAGFRAALNGVSASIITPELEAALPRLRRDAERNLPPADWHALATLLHRTAHRCWSGELAVITPALWLDAVRTDSQLSGESKAQLAQLLQEAVADPHTNERPES